jgi:hypothetical protein
MYVQQGRKYEHCGMYMHAGTKAVFVEGTVRAIRQRVAVGCAQTGSLGTQCCLLQAGLVIASVLIAFLHAEAMRMAYWGLWGSPRPFD